MVAMSRWCMAHRRWVVGIWVLIAIVSNVVAQSAGRNYSTNFTLPGTQSQRVNDLLTKEFPTQGGDLDTIVFNYANGRYDAGAGEGCQGSGRRQRAQPIHPGGVRAGVKGRPHGVRDR